MPDYGCTRGMLRGGGDVVSERWPFSDCGEIFDRRNPSIPRSAPGNASTPYETPPSRAVGDADGTALEVIQRGESFVALWVVRGKAGQDDEGWVVDSGVLFGYVRLKARVFGTG